MGEDFRRGALGTADEEALQQDFLKAAVPHGGQGGAPVLPGELPGELAQMGDAYP